MLTPVDGADIPQEVQEQNGGAESPHDEMLHLSGRPSLKQFLSFVDENSAHPLPDADLVDEWHAAREVLRKIEEEEAGIADHPPIVKLGPEYESLLIEFLKDPIVQRSFNTVPTQVALVELDRMVVYQQDIDLSHTRRIEQRVGGLPDRDLLFRTCLPYHHPQPPVKWCQQDDETFTFISPSRDMRSFDARCLLPKHLQLSTSADLVGMVAVGVGFGSNFLNALYVENRLILNNGSHRAYALRNLGVTHAPCIVQHVPSREALMLFADREIRKAPDQFLKDPRPPMFKDYFNREITKVFAARRQYRQVTVHIEVTERSIPAF